MEYSELNKMLMLHFPEFQSLYKEQLDFWKEPPPQHCFYGAVLNEFVVNLLLENQDVVMISKVFDFYEELAQSEDVEVNNLLQVTLLEYVACIFLSGIYLLCVVELRLEIQGAREA
jgi:hypothetical protein